MPVEDSSFGFAREFSNGLESVDNSTHPIRGHNLQMVSSPIEMHIGFFGDSSGFWGLFKQWGQMVRDNPGASFHLGGIIPR